jgi:hypothetical protein
MKPRTVILFLVLAVLAAFYSQHSKAATLEDALKDSVPVDKGTCNVPTQKHGLMAMECVKGLRADGATIYLILDNGQPIGVYEQIGDGAPKLIWAANWKEA